ncbi:MAG: hypothetical protein Q9162_007550 [Coniocarpon cinnabarinum]
MADPSGVISLTAGASALAWKLYKSCRDSPGQYKELSHDTKQLANILREIDDMMEDDPHVGLKRSDFVGSIQSCNALLLDLRVCLDKYKSLGTQQRRLPDRLKWDQQEVKRLHARINHSIQMLSMSVQRYNASTQGRVVRLLNDILEQLRKGQRKAQSVSSFAAAKEGNEEEAWPGIVQDLSDLGLDEDDAEENRELIISILREARVEGYGSEPDNDWQSPPESPPHQQSVAEFSPQARSPGPGTETIASSSPAPGIFSSPGSMSDRPESMTSHDTSLTSTFAAFQLQSAQSRRYLSIFDPVAMQVEAEVKRQPNTLKDDINLAKRYWSEQDWANSKKRLLRLLVASELPHHRRPDLSPKLITFVLGVACAYSGDLETARLAFTSLLTSKCAPHATSTSLGSPTLGLTASGPGPDLGLEDAEIAAATWLGDICLMTDRGADAALAYSIVLYALKHHLSTRSPRPGSLSSAIAQEPAPLSSLNRSTLKRSSTSGNVVARPIHEQLVACELSIVGSKLGHLEELVENIHTEDFPHAGSVFEDVSILPDRADALHIAFGAQLATGSLSSSEYPLYRDMRIRAADQMSDNEPDDQRARVRIVERSSTCELVPVEERLTLRPSRAGWPLMWNPHFSIYAPLHASEWYHNISTAPEDTLLSNIRALPQFSAKTHTSDFTFAKDEADNVISGIRQWLIRSHIDFKQFPTELRCRPQPDHANQWPKIAVFAIGIHILKERDLSEYQRRYTVGVVPI